MSPRFRSFGLASVALTAAWLIMYSVPSALSSPETAVRIVGLLDQWDHYVPMAVYMDSAIQDGEFPLWNPLTFCGIPFAANPQSYAFYPPNLIRSLLTPEATPINAHVGLAIVLALHTLLAGMSTFFLARDHELGQGASLSASFVFIFSATFVRRTMSCHLITTVCWFPLVLLLLRRAFVAEDLRSRVLYSTAAGTAFGLAVLAGFPQMVLYMAFATIGYGIAYRLLHLQQAGSVAGRGLSRVLVEDLVVGVLLFVVAGLLAAAMLIPASELASFSERAHVENIPIGGLQSISWVFELLTSYVGLGNQHGNYRLAGSGAFILALAAFIHPRKRDVILFAILFCILLDCALGPPLPFSRMLMGSAPFGLKDHSRAVLALGLPLAMLSGFGVDAVVARWRTRDLRPVSSLLFAIVGILAIHRLRESATSEAIFSIPDSAWVFPAAVLALVVLAGMPLPRFAAAARSAASGWGVRRGRSVSIAVALLLPLLLFGELVAWGHPYLGYLRNRWGYKAAVAPLSERGTLWSDNHRQADKHPNRSVMALKPAINGYDALYIERVQRVLQSPPIPDMSLSPAAVLAKNQRGNLFLKRSLWLSRRYVEGPLPDAETLFPASTTVFLKGVPDDLGVPRVERATIAVRSISEQALQVPLAIDAGTGKRAPGAYAGIVRHSFEIPAFELRPLNAALIVHYSSDTSAIVNSKFRDVVSGIRMPGKILKARPTGSAGGRLEFPLPDFPRMEASLQVKHPARAGGFRIEAAHLEFDRNDENGHIRDLRRSFNSLDVELVDLPASRVLTFIDTHYPGWHAYLDGAEVPIHLANDAFKAVVVPQGTHRVRFEFRPTSVYVGVAVSSVALVAVVATFGYARLRPPPASGRRRRSEATSA